jgi:hypothetical protein
MLPVIGKAPRHPGLWFDFGHQHHGHTLGPATGRLLAEMMRARRHLPTQNPLPPKGSVDAARQTALEASSGTLGAACIAAPVAAILGQRLNRAGAEMKVNIEIDCTPLEARQFIGLPDLAPMQTAVMTSCSSR